jgi:hypothetical protein
MIPKFKDALEFSVKLGFFSILIKFEVVPLGMETFDFLSFALN